VAVGRMAALFSAQKDRACNLKKYMKNKNCKKLVFLLNTKRPY
jgi:hypothetical protein